MAPALSNGARLHPKLRGHVRWAHGATRRLARALFHAMARFGPKLEREQVLLGRFVDLGTELFALSATCARAQQLGAPEALALADYFCRTARLRIESSSTGCTTTPTAPATESRSLSLAASTSGWRREFWRAKAPLLLTHAFKPRQHLSELHRHRLAVIREERKPV